jgi:YbgC/YbaW family acyl-CoA thioester hydrolase
MPPFQTTRRVEFGDTDMVGIVHFSNFFRYMEAAETDFLRSLGFSVAWSQHGQRFGFPRVAASCDYTKPAVFGDLLTVTVTVEKVGTKSVTYRFDFTRGADAIATGRITCVCCQKGDDGGMKSVELPPEVRAKLEG